MECGKVGAAAQDPNRNGLATEKPCKYCEEVFTDFGKYGAHRWAVHREEVLAELRRKREQRKVDEKKIDAAPVEPGTSGASPATRAARRPRPSGHPATEAACPMCGGGLPATTAQLIGELVAAGISEDQAFAAARIARRILAAGSTA